MSEVIKDAAGNVIGFGNPDKVGSQGEQLLRYAGGPVSRPVIDTANLPQTPPESPAEAPPSLPKAEPYSSSEQIKVLTIFMTMLDSVTRDGGKKRKAGTKPPWYIDPSHEAAIFSHLNKWKHGEKLDPDSGAHPLVHLAWRALAIAYQESIGKVAP